MVVDVPRRWRTIIGVLALVALVEVVWLWAGAREALPPALAAEPSRHPSPTSEPLTADGSGGAQATSPPQDSAGAGDDQVQICDRWLKLRPDGTLDAVDFDRVTGTAQARARVSAGLRADGSDYGRAVALLVEMSDIDGATREVLETQSPDHDCAGACSAAHERWEERRRRSRDELARLAASTNDARVYALATMTCATLPPGDDASPCQQLSTAQWARLDPGNAVPWMYELQRASDRKDGAAGDEALFRIASATRSQLRYLDAAAAVLAQMPSDTASALPAMRLGVDIVAISAALQLPGYQSLLQRCGAPALQDANRRQVCQAIGELMTRRSDTMIERGIGTALGERLGWSAEVTDRLRGETDAYLHAQSSALDNPASMSCDAVRREVERLAHVGTVGEAAAMREWLAQSGSTAEELMRRGRELRLQREASAASAAAARAASGARP